MKKIHKLLIIGTITVTATLTFSTLAFAKDIIIDNNNSIFSNEDVQNSTIPSFVKSMNIKEPIQIEFNKTTQEIVVIGDNNNKCTLKIKDNNIKNIVNVSCGTN